MPANNAACRGAAADAAAGRRPLASCHAPAAHAAAAWLPPPTASSSHEKALKPTWQQNALSCLQVHTHSFIHSFIHSFLYPLNMCLYQQSGPYRPQCIPVRVLAACISFQIVSTRSLCKTLGSTYANSKACQGQITQGTCSGYTTHMLFSWNSTVAHTSLAMS